MFSKILRKITPPLCVTHAPVLTPWFRPLLKKNCISAEIHRIYLKGIPLHPETSNPQASKKLQYKVKQLCYTFSWPLTSAVHALLHVKNYGDTLKKQYGIPKCVQFFKTWRFGVLFNFPADSVYQNKLFSLTKTKLAIDFLHHEQIVSIIPFLNRHIDLSKSDNKTLFYKRMKEAALPTIPIIAEFMEKGTTWFTSEEKLPPKDLFAKFTDAYCGAGAEKWIFNAKSSCWERDSQQLNEEQMINRFVHRSSNGSIIVQPVVKNHSFVDQYAPNVLSTLRITTYQPVSGDVKLILAAFRMPTHSKDVDNFHAGGIAAGVNSDGTLTSAVSLEPDSPRHMVHPCSKAKIEGETLPQWDETLKLVLKAHQCFPDIRMIGWDVAQTPEGPVLVEANTGWCVKVLQIPNQTPILSTPFSHYYLKCYELAS